MKRNDSHQTNAPNCWIALERVTRTTWALENAKSELSKVLELGNKHPAFHNLQVELRNLDCLLRSLPIPRGEDGRPLHPTDCGRRP